VTATGVAKSYGMNWGVMRKMFEAADKLKELAWTGRKFDGREALELGVVTALHQDPLQAAKELANRIAGRSPDGLWAGIAAESLIVARESEVPMARVCQNFACRLPVSIPVDLAGILDGENSSAQP